jgi:hypothetical protein
MVLPARIAAMRMGFTDCIARAALPQGLLPFRYSVGTYLRDYSPRCAVSFMPVMDGLSKSGLLATNDLKAAPRPVHSSLS